MPTDAPNGLLNSYVVNPGKGKRKAANVTTEDTAVTEDAPAKPAKKSTAKATDKG
jgi:hypothetical protein